MHQVGDQSRLCNTCCFSTANKGYANESQCYVIQTLPVLLSHIIYRLSNWILLENWVSANIFPATMFSYDFPSNWQALLTKNEATERMYTWNISYSPSYVWLFMLVTLVGKLSPGKIWFLRKGLDMCKQLQSFLIKRYRFKSNWYHIKTGST